MITSALGPVGCAQLQVTCVHPDGMSQAHGAPSLPKPLSVAKEKLMTSLRPAGDSSQTCCLGFARSVSILN
jgi:hypothetical protein